MVFILVNMAFCYFKRQFDRFSFKKTDQKPTTAIACPPLPLLFFAYTLTVV